LNILNLTNNKRNETEEKYYNIALEKAKKTMIQIITSKNKAVETMKRLNPEVLYFEGNEIRDTIPIIAAELGVKILFLDEGVKDAVLHVILSHKESDEPV